MVMTSLKIESAVNCLLSARRGGNRPEALPSGSNPSSWEDVYAIQDAVFRQLGPLAGWKVGAVTPEAEPFRAALAADSVTIGPAERPAHGFHVIGAEAELAYRFVRDLPPRAEPYGVEEVVAAIGSVHAAIEIVDTRFARWQATDPLSHAADQMNHGVLVVGTGIAQEDTETWRRLNPLTQPVVLRIGGTIVAQGIGGNSAGDPLRMLVWMANGGAHSLGGLRAGTTVTTGSCTGTIFADRPKDGEPLDIVAEFPGIGTATLTIV